MIRLSKLINRAYNRELSYILEFINIYDNNIESQEYDMFEYSTDSNGCILVDSIKYNYIDEQVEKIDNLKYINDILDTNKYSKNKVIIDDLIPIKYAIGELVYKFNKVYNSNTIRIWEYQNNKLKFIKDEPIRYFNNLEEYEESLRNPKHMNVEFIMKFKNRYKITPKLKTYYKYIKLLDILIEI